MLAIRTQNPDHQLLCRGQAPERRTLHISFLQSSPQDPSKWWRVEAWWRALWWPPSCWPWFSLDQQVWPTVTQQVVWNFADLHQLLLSRQTGQMLHDRKQDADKRAHDRLHDSGTSPSVCASCDVSKLPSSSRDRILYHWICQFLELYFVLPAAFKRHQAFTAFRSTLTGSRPRSPPLSTLI